MSVLGSHFEIVGSCWNFRFKFSYLYELDSLAVVNVRDLGGIKHAFKLLVFPDARLFQCANGDAKQVREGEHAGAAGVKMVSVFARNIVILVSVGIY